MPKITIREDILAPDDTIKVRFNGKNPSKIMPKIQSMLKYIMKLESKNILETDVRWDVSGDPREFYGMWMGKRGEDRWTTTLARVIAQGAESSKDKKGWIELKIKGTVETKYEYSNFLQRSFWFFFNHTFYYKQRRHYLEDAKDDLYDIREAFQEEFGIVPGEDVGR